MDQEIAQNEAIQVLGPSKIKVTKGEVEIFGKKLQTGQSLIIKQGKSYPIRAIKLTILKIQTESSENVKKLEENAFSGDKTEFAKEILNLPKPCKVMLIGESDTGKSSFITYLANTCFEHGLKTAVLDLDMGQQDIGPPCTIGFGFLKYTIFNLKEIPVNQIFFIGSNSPVGHESRCLTGITNLLEKLRAQEADVTFLDTSGWVKGIGARNYKLAKIELIQPDLLIGMQREREVEYFLKPFQQQLKIRRFTVSPQIQSRSMNSRKFLREASYRKYFENARSLSINCDEVGFAYSLFKSGARPDQSTLTSIQEILDLKAEYCEICRDAILFVQAEEKLWKLDNLNLLKEKFNVHHIHIAQINGEIGILVGLVGINEHLGIGIIEKIEYLDNKISIFTPIAREMIKQVQFGGIRISKSGKEIEKIRPFF